MCLICLPADEFLRLAALDPAEEPHQGVDFRESGSALSSALSCSWAMGDEETANAVGLWLAEARASGLPHCVRPAQTIEEHLAELLAYFATRSPPAPRAMGIG